MGMRSFPVKKLSRTAVVVFWCLQHVIHMRAVAPVASRIGFSFCGLFFPHVAIIVVGSGRLCAYVRRYAGIGCVSMRFAACVNCSYCRRRPYFWLHLLQNVACHSGRHFALVLLCLVVAPGLHNGLSHRSAFCVGAVR